MLELGIIWPSSSIWASPLPPHGTEGGAWRLKPCSDYRALNSTFPDCYPLLHIHDLTENLAATAIYSKIDLVKTHYKISVAPEACQRLL